MKRDEKKKLLEGFAALASVTADLYKRNAEEKQKLHAVTTDFKALQGAFSGDISAAVEQKVEEDYPVDQMIHMGRVHAPPYPNELPIPRLQIECQRIGNEMKVRWHYYLLIGTNTSDCWELPIGEVHKTSGFEEVEVDNFVRCPKQLLDRMREDAGALEVSAVVVNWDRYSVMERKSGELSLSHKFMSAE